MEEWKIFLTIGTVLTFVGMIIGPISKLITAIVKLTDSVDSLKLSFEETNANNSKTHERIWNELETHEEKIVDHETRLQLIEKK